MADVTKDGMLNLVGAGKTITMHTVTLPRPATGGINATGIFAYAGAKGLGSPSPDVYESAGFGDGGIVSSGRFNTRPIEIPIVCTARGLSTQAAARTQLNTFVRDFMIAVQDPGAYLRIENPFSSDDGSLYLRLSIQLTDSIDWVYGDDTDGSTWVKTVVPLKSGNPFWVGETAITTTLSNLSGSQSVTIKGNAPALPVFNVTARTSITTAALTIAITPVTLPHQATRFGWSAASGVTSGGTGVLTPESCSLSGIFTNSVSVFSGGLSWMKLYNGSNTVAISSTNIQSVSMAYYPRYIGVI